LKLLLDTHTFLWFIGGNDELGQNVQLLIENSINECFLSVANLWEMAIKISIGRLKLEIPSTKLLTEQALRIFN